MHTVTNAPKTETARPSIVAEIERRYAAQLAQDERFREGLRNTARGFGR